MLDRIGDIVRSVRGRAQQSIADVAQRSGVPAEVLEALERGMAGITTTQLSAVAEALTLDAVALLDGREVARPVPSVFLRHGATQDFDDRDAAVLDAALEQGRALAALRAMLRQPPLALQAGLFLPQDAAADREDAPAQDGYRLAREVRHWRQTPGDPIADMRAFVEELIGAVVLVRDLSSSKVTAASVRAESAAAIVLSAADPLRTLNPLLDRVYLAHELCHVLFDPLRGGLHIVIDAIEDRKVDVAEKRARAFAAELLIPSAGLTAVIGPPLQITETGRALELVQRARSHFGTPHEIAANHLCNHGYIDRRLRQWLGSEKTPFSGAPATTLPPSGAPSLTLSELVAAAHRETVVTDAEARAILGIDRLAPLPWEGAEP
jgi:Zn-dependent peptidase ImmA (M78 family)